MPTYTVTEPFGARATVCAIGVESAKELGRIELGLPADWPMVALSRPDPPGLRTRTRLWVRPLRIEASRIVSVT